MHKICPEKKLLVLNQTEGMYYLGKENEQTTTKGKKSVG